MLYEAFPAETRLTVYRGAPMGKHACLYLVCFFYCLLITFTLILTGNLVFYVSWFCADVCYFLILLVTLILVGFAGFSVILIHDNIDSASCPHACSDMGKKYMFICFVYCFVFILALILTGNLVFFRTLDSYSYLLVTLMPFWAILLHLSFMFPFCLCF